MHLSFQPIRDVLSSYAGIFMLAQVLNETLATYDEGRLQDGKWLSERFLNRTFVAPGGFSDIYSTSAAMNSGKHPSPYHISVTTTPPEKYHVRLYTIVVNKRLSSSSPMNTGHSSTDFSTSPASGQVARDCHGMNPYAGIIVLNVGNIQVHCQPRYLL
ncbi:hypothetical protein BV898_18278 [Hypsibius exemplaris]|uniref:Receptor ligand binding region domain-containing protein n=1 Tax=Hypsibius exemplaris TaxID=2072580 RepID=A0A9X6NJQ5_HYPEX|nr:hypothetical protein BV898_18278 [Hypsibius exemplaris]